MKTVTAGCCQFDVIPGDVDRNMSAVESRLPRFAGAGCNLLVLPEMWSCSFPYPTLPEMAARTPEILRRVEEWAASYGMVLVGSLPEAGDGQIYNTSFVVDATGKVAGKYRKAHLFSLLGEHLHFGRGESPLVCSTIAGSIGVMICYDLRFPELARRLALDGAEILCVSAQWPRERIDHWSALLRARAIENQLFVVACNGSGTENRLQYGGSSSIISPTGTVLAGETPDGDPPLAALDFSEMENFRQRIPCFADRVPKVYGLGA
ncbi:MAG: carbon-nitrogen family hydrolase [Deltaproteobacteria bacterium]|nr:carbon-nitrogen family hydrolase [Deltaproteobacteria bacterium]